jgi:hypothetical protein
VRKKIIPILKSHLGVLMIEGIGTPQNHKAGVPSLFKKAAKNAVIRTLSSSSDGSTKTE